MRRISLGIAMIGLLIVLGSTCAGTADSASTVYYVAANEPGANDANNGLYPTYQSGQDGPWLTIQHAASTMTAGDTTYVRAGTYYESDIRFANSGAPGAPVTLANYQSEEVIIDGSQDPEVVAGLWIDKVSGHYVIQGLTIRNMLWSGIETDGSTTETYQDITIRDCTLYDNGWSGIELAAVDGFLVENVEAYSNGFYGLNISGSADGTLSAANGVVRNSSFYNHTGDEGHGLAINQGHDIAVSDCAAYHNTIHGFDVSDWPKYGELSYNITFDRNYSYDNGLSGFAINSDSHHVVYRNNIAWRNSTDWGGWGGGLGSGFYCYEGCWHVEWVNNTSLENAKAGFRIDGQLGDYGTPNDHLLVFKNNVTYNNDPSNDWGWTAALLVEPLDGDTWEVVATHNDWSVSPDHNWAVHVQGTTYRPDEINSGAFQTGNISVDPQFVDPTAPDAHLLPSSPAIDTGANEAAPADDFDSNPRPLDGDSDGTAVVDMGAYEFTLLGDLDHDCDVDIADIMLVAARWHTAVGDPDYFAAYDLDDNGRIDIVDIMLVAVHWGESCPGAEFIRRKGNQLVVGADEQPIRLRGINFTNDVDWADYTWILESEHHSEVDFQRVSDMGMNVIRFMLDYRFFEDDAFPYVYHQEGWDWLDQNLDWAKSYGVYLILDMQITQGGRQEGPDEGIALWTDVEKQNRLKALWKAIAERYKDESMIAAYDLVNEPYPPERQQWKTLAQELIDEIRSVDKNHLIIVEKCYSDEQDYILFLVNDDNVMYDFHFYYPMPYTHQYNEGSHGDGGYYPDPDVSVVPYEFVWADAAENPRVPIGDSDWSFYEGSLYHATNPQIILGVPVFVCGKSQGTVCFDDFIMEEYDDNQGLLRRMSVDIDCEEQEWTLPGIDPFESYPKYWLPWTANGEQGSHAVAEIGHRGDHSLSITGVTNEYSLSNSALSFAVKQHYYYKLSGWMKGIGVTDESCQMTMEFHRLPDGEDFAPFDRGYLEDVLVNWLEFGATNNVPLNVGEFGLMKYCFMDNIGGFAGNRGGLTWARDMLELFDQYGIHYQYLGYHLHDFGIYRNTEGLPDPASANQELIDLFTEFLGGAGESPAGSFEED